MRDAFHRDPYKQPPVAPVLYIKPANTWAGEGDAIRVPPGVDRLRVGGTLGVVIGRKATRVSERDALDHVAGYTVANDVEIPHESYFRPPVREKCRDGFLPLGPFAGAGELDPDAAEIRVFVNGALASANSTRNLVRGVARLIADITEFMTLEEGETPIAPRTYEEAAGNVIGAVSESGRLLVFDIGEMRQVARGRGVIIMGLEEGEKLVAAAVFDGKTLVVAGTGRGGKQKELTLSGEKLKHHFGRRARMGRVLPDKLKPAAIQFPPAPRREAP